MTNLKNLWLINNKISGNIPVEIGNLINLEYLVLQYNELTGIIPVEICNQGDTTPNVLDNKLWPPYPECISQEDINSQDTSNCP